MALRPGHGNYARLFEQMNDTVLAILMLAGFALTGGGIYLLAKKRDRKQAMLMLVAGVVMFANVAIMTAPF